MLFDSNDGDGILLVCCILMVRCKRRVRVDAARTLLKGVRDRLRQQGHLEGDDDHSVDELDGETDDDVDELDEESEGDEDDEESGEESSRSGSATPEPVSAALDEAMEQAPAT